jgi:hypothetical protein
VTTREAEEVYIAARDARESTRVMRREAGEVEEEVEGERTLRRRVSVCRSAGSVWENRRGRASADARACFLIDSPSTLTSAITSTLVVVSVTAPISSSSASTAASGANPGAAS